MVLLAMQNMLEWYIPVIITSANADTQGSLPKKTEMSNEQAAGSAIVKLSPILVSYAAQNRKKQEKEMKTETRKLLEKKNTYQIKGDRNMKWDGRRETNNKKGHYQVVNDVDF
eukprot:13002804-Ditylum_brightwellii.AAC.2